MKLTEDIELIEGFPIMYIKSINALVVSDIHLGYEGVMAKRGILIPKVNLISILEMLKKAIDAKNPERIIINGDMKNEFSHIDTEEFDEMSKMVKFSEKVGIKLTLIKGNHDNFVDRYRQQFNIDIHEQSIRIGGYLFFHGERIPPKNKKVEMFIMGHEHPAISIFTDVGKKEKLRCFLFGEYNGRNILILPAMNYFAGSTDVNIIPKEKLLSPIFSEMDLDSMHAIVIGYGSTIDFGSVSKLRYAAHRAKAGILE